MTDISCELREARYQLNGIIKELAQVEGGGYLSMTYIEEKVDKILFECKQIAKLKGFIK